MSPRARERWRLALDIGICFAFAGFIALRVLYGQPWDWPFFDKATRHWLEIILVPLFILVFVPWRISLYLRRAEARRISEQLPSAKQAEQDESEGFW